MEGNIVSPTGCTQPSRLTSPELVYGTGGAIDDRHRPDVEIRTSRANYRLPNPALNGMLLTAYMYLAWLVVILAIMGLCTTSVYFMSPVNSPVEFFADAFASHLTLYVVWLASAYLMLHVHAWKMGARMNKYIWNMSARMHKYTPCVILPFTLALMLLMVSDTSGYGCVYSAAQGTWRTGLLPTAPSVCEQRLEETQHILLHTEYYSAQFARALIQNVSERDYVFSWLNFNETRFLQIHNNEDLCYQGFEGNPDIYGLGVRLCIYLQWIVALITNNLLPHGRPTHQAAWLIFSIGMCIVAFLASTADYCVFGIEIEILYWVYWGGFACVYASAPSLTRLRGQVKWVALEWSTAIRYTLHILMACHGVWFSWWGYDQAFARMPCGTYQFMLAKFLDPSTSYSYARDFLSLALNMMATPFLLVLSVATVIMALEIKASVQNLASGSNGDESERYAAGLPTRVHDRFLSMTREVYSFVVWLMDPSPGDIRLITPVDVQQRRSYRIRCLLMWLVSFSISVTAIETTLSWNRVTSVHSLTSLGQMLSLIIGMATFISVIWELFKQESKRRQDAKRRRIAPGDTLPQLPLTLSGAIRSAFHQLDEPFLTNAVALPSFKTNPPGSEVLSDNGSYTTGADNRMGLQSSDATWQ